MSFEDIKISELPPLSKVVNEDTLVVNNDRTKLTYQVSWDSLKNSLGTLANPVIFPLGVVDNPAVAIGDNSAGIYASDYGTLTLATQARDRLQIDQAGTINLINGNVVVGRFDRTCLYTLTINSASTFNCKSVFRSGIETDGDSTFGNLSVTGDSNFEGNVSLGSDCNDTITIKGESTIECDLKVDGDTDVKGTLDISGDLIVDGSTDIGIPNNSCAGYLSVHSPATFDCDIDVGGNLSVGGNTIFDGNVTVNGSILTRDSGGATIDVNDRLEKVNASLTSLKYAADTASDFASLKSAIVIALSNI